MKTSLLLFCQARSYFVLARTTRLSHYLEAARYCLVLCQAYKDLEFLDEEIYKRYHDQMGDTAIINIKDVA